MEASKLRPESRDDDDIGHASSAQTRHEHFRALYSMREKITDTENRCSPEDLEKLTDTYKMSEE